MRGILRLGLLVSFLPLVTFASTINVPVGNSINTAIAGAAAGDTIQLGAGTYRENVVVDKTLSMAGAGQGVTILQPATINPDCRGGGAGSLCTGGTMASNVILVQANNVVVHDLTIDGDNPTLSSGVGSGGADIDARNGIIENFNTGTYNGLTVFNTTVQNIYLRGLYESSGGSSFNIHDNTITNVQADPSSIAVFSFGGAGTIQNNHVSACLDGVVANHSRGINFLNNVITTSGSGVHTDNAGDSGGVADVITGNTVTNAAAGGYGIFVFVPYIAPTVQNNSVTNVDVGLALFGLGPIPITPTFVGNHLDGASRAKSIGVLITTDQLGFGQNSTSAIVKSNDIQNWPEGVEIDETGGATATVQLLLNRILNNTTGVNNTGATPVNAANNWWGCNYGPGATGAGCSITTNGVSGSVTSNPYLILGNTVPSAMVNGQSAAANATLRINSAATDTSPSGFVPDGIPMTIGATLGVLIVTSGASASGILASSFTAGHTNGSATITTTADAQTVTNSVVITDAALTPAGVTINGTEQTLLSNVTVATFTDPDPSAIAAEFTAMIAWGDGSTSTGTITGSAGSFTVTGSYTYADEGNYAITVTINDVGGASAIANSNAKIADAPLNGSGTNFNFAVATPFNGQVATFTDGNLLATASDFTASINWGDGTTTPGTVISTGPGAFKITGLHTFATAGPFTVTTSINDIGGATAIPTATASSGPSVPAMSPLMLAMCGLALAVAGVLRVISDR